MSDVKSRAYFEQMKGRGTQTLSPTELQAVSGADARAKTRFVIVDASKASVCWRASCSGAITEGEF